MKMIRLSKVLLVLLAGLALATPHAHAQTNITFPDLHPNDQDSYLKLQQKQILAILAGSGSSSGLAAVSTVSNDSSATATATSSTALAANASRLNATVVNYGSTGCFVALKASATSGSGIYLAPNGGSYSIDANNLYRGIITVVTTSGTTTLAIHEGQ